MLFLGSFVNALVDVLAIIGIILVGGFLIFFLGDLVLSVLDPNYTRFGRKNKEKKEEKTEDKEEVKALPEVQEQPVEALTFKAEEPVEEFKFDEPEQPAEEEKIEEVKEIEQAKEDALADLRAEEEEFRANMLKSIEERQAKKEETKDGKYDEFFFGDEDLTAFDDEEEKFDEVNRNSTGRTTC